MRDVARRWLGKEPREPRWVIQTREGAEKTEYRVPRGRFRRGWYRHAMLVNLPFLLGLLMVGVLVAGSTLARETTC